MCFRSLIHVIVYFVLMVYVCNADGILERVKRDHDDSDNDGSMNIGQMINSFLSNLYGYNITLEDVADKQMNESFKQALQSFLTNISQTNNASNENDQGVNLEVQQQTMTSQSPSSTKRVTSTSPPGTSITSTSTWIQESSTYPLEDDRCYTDVVFQNFCPVPDDITDVSFWDLSALFFSDSVVDALMIDCPKGTWCLQNKYDYWDSIIAERTDMVMNSEISASICSPTFQPCFDNVLPNFVNCSTYSQMLFVSDVVKLVCGLKRNPRLTTSCYKHVISALHVTLADILREEEIETEPAEDRCESPEAQMTKALICVENSCPGESETFHSFKPWTWFTSVVDDLIDECGYDPNTCRALLQPPPGMGSLVAVSVAVMVTALTLTLVVCTCYKRHRRTAVVKEGYQRLLTDGDES